MNKKTSEVEEIEAIMDGQLPKGLTPLEVKLWYVDQILDWHTKAVAKEKMELVERIEVMKKDQDSYGLAGQFTEGYCKALDDVLSALKSEIQEKEEVGIE